LTQKFLRLGVFVAISFLIRHEGLQRHEVFKPLFLGYFSLTQIGLIDRFSKKSLFTDTKVEKLKL
jgi:hypothetical protein